MKRISLTQFIRRRWMILVAVAVVALAGFAVDRLHDAFVSKKDASSGSGASNEIVPFNPKQVIYEVFGTPGSTATINYQDVHAAPQRVDNVPLPWSYTITTTDPAVIANVVAQGNGSTLGCRITVNGIVKAERTVNEVSAYTFCLDKSG
ncbi:MmpS family transport accessory protein [Mycobacterium cookii]|uniref:Membrane protein n=1 Tax=Mycobacterium cookii TaxID=1775 RepID=A0A7I7L3L2_9MYCO|nr:MmpS family transport accessory protein [Mycobacterium cookii]MCV7328994.1 transport acessory protein MmpS [Mycobacterium cookii]BBX48338.1 membrane protein [Mycobacterium cookii]